MRTIAMTMIVLWTCMSCSEQHDHGDRMPLAGIDGHYLYADEVEAMLPLELSGEDSARFVDRYVRNWLEDVLLYEKAQDNIADVKAIEERVENYRKALVVHAYQQALLEQQLLSDITEDELERYFDSHQDVFKVERPLIKGLFIKVPLQAPRVDDVRRWYKSTSLTSVEHLEKYSLQNAVRYEYFYDEWRSVADIEVLLPQQERPKESLFLRKQPVELKDSAFYYFLNVTDCLSVGEQEPYELARERVKGLLLNMRQVAFLEEVKDELYRQALKENKINYYSYKHQE